MDLLKALGVDTKRRPKCPLSPDDYYILPFKKKNAFYFWHLEIRDWYP